MKRKLLFLFPLLTLILLTTTALTAVRAQTYNRKLTDAFAEICASTDEETWSGMFDYETALRESTLTADKLRSHYPQFDGTAAYTALISLTAAPKSIRYYQNIGDTTPAYVIHKGELILHSGQSTNTLFGNFYSACQNYACTDLCSLPADVPGWRLVYPMDTEEQDAPKQLLYVKLSDLRFLMEYWMKDPLIRQIRTLELPDPTAMYELEFTVGPLASAKTDAEWIEQCLLRYDHFLFQNGIYLSPDLYRAVFPRSSRLLTVLAVFSLTAWLILRKHPAQGSIERTNSGSEGREVS